MNKPATIPYARPDTAKRGRWFVLTLLVALSLLPVGLPVGQRAWDAFSERQRIRQGMRSRFDSAICTVRRNIATGQVEDLRRARVHLDVARLARSANPTVFSERELAHFDARVRELEQALDGVETRLLAQFELHSCSLRTPPQRVDALRDLYVAGLRLIRQGRFAEATAVVDQIIVLDPGDARAWLLRPVVRLASIVQLTLNGFPGAKSSPASPSRSPSSICPAASVMPQPGRMSWYLPWGNWPSGSAGKVQVAAFRAAS